MEWTYSFHPKPIFPLHLKVMFNKICTMTLLINHKWLRRLNQMVKETKSLHMINHKHKTRVILGAMKCKYQTPNTTKNALWRYQQTQNIDKINWFQVGQRDWKNIFLRKRRRITLYMHFSLWCLIYFLNLFIVIESFALDNHNEKSIALQGLIKG